MPDLTHPNEDLYPHGLISFSKGDPFGTLHWMAFLRLSGLMTVSSSLFSNVAV